MDDLTACLKQHNHNDIIGRINGYTLLANDGTNFYWIVKLERPEQTIHVMAAKNSDSTFDYCKMTNVDFDYFE